MSMMGKVVVITGSSMGIGEAVAARFLREGASVVYSSRDHGRAEEARLRAVAVDASAESRSVAIACDVMQRAQIESLLAQTLARFGRLDVWINNAGFGMMDSVARMDMAECRRMFDTNLFGAIDCMQVVAPVLKQQRSGAIVNIASMASFISVPYMSAYGATKHALLCIGRAARLELAPYGVQVNTVCPGIVDNEFGLHCVLGREGKRFAGGRLRGIPVSQCAEAVWRAYRKNQGEVIVPRRGNLVIALYRLLPAVFNLAMVRAMRPMRSGGSQGSTPGAEQR